mmetsp:Transcript_8149/g.25135  ORF Transcript_8149/g.25135 Transcript_8149/m.25135 type:complete len:724 (-) Transcript_8149:776-2947(-)
MERTGHDKCTRQISRVDLETRARSGRCVVNEDGPDEGAGIGVVASGPIALGVGARYQGSGALVLVVEGPVGVGHVVGVAEVEPFPRGVFVDVAATVGVDRAPLGDKNGDGRGIFVVGPSAFLAVAGNVIRAEDALANKRPFPDSMSAGVEVRGVRDVFGVDGVERGFPDVLGVEARPHNDEVVRDCADDVNDLLGIAFDGLESRRGGVGHGTPWRVDWFVVDLEDDVRIGAVVCRHEFEECLGLVEVVLGVVAVPVDDDVDAAGDGGFDDNAHSALVTIRIVQVARFLVDAHGGAHDVAHPVVDERVDDALVVELGAFPPRVAPEQAHPGELDGRGAVVGDDAVARCLQRAPPGGRRRFAGGRARPVRRWSRGRSVAGGSGGRRVERRCASALRELSGERFHLVEEPLAGLRRVRLVALGPDGIDRRAAFVVARAGAVGDELVGLAREGLSAAVRLAGGLEPEVSVDDVGVERLAGGPLADENVSRVAPRGAVGPGGGVAVAAGVDDEVWLEAGNGVPEGGREELGVVVLVVGLVPLVEEAAWVVAARVVSAGGRVGEAVDVVGARLTEVLVVGDVGRKAAQVVLNAQVGDGSHEGVEVGIPAEPAAVCGVEVEGDLVGVLGDLLDGVCDALGVGVLGSLVAAVGVVRIGREVWERVRLDDNSNRDNTVELAEDSDVRVYVGCLVLLDALGTVSRVVVVAGAVAIVSAADLPARGVGVAVAVR